MAIDLFLAGPSCRDVSRLNSQRKAYAGSYVPDDDGATHGSSGTTYVFGVKKAGVSWNFLSCVCIIFGPECDVFENGPTKGEYWLLWDWHGLAELYIAGRPF